MTLDDLTGYKLTCKMSSDYKNEPDYSDKEFTVIISKDEDSELGYSANISGKDLDDEEFTDTRDAETVGKHILFGNWIVVKKERL